MNNTRNISVKRKFWPNGISVGDMVVVCGVPLFLWIAVLLMPNQGHTWTYIAVTLQLAYFFLNPTAERSVLFFLSYFFSVGGNKFAPFLVGSITQVPIWVNLCSYFIIPILFIHTLLKGRLRSGKKFLQPILFLILISFLSTLWHWNGWISLLDLGGWLLHFLRYPLWFLILINNDISEHKYIFFMKVFIWLAFLQIPTTILLVLLGWTIGADNVLGTMYGAGTGLMGLTVAVAFCACLANNIVNKKSLYNFIFLFSLFIPVLLGGAGFAILMLVLLFSYIYFITLTPRPLISIIVNYRMPRIYFLAIILLLSVVVIGPLFRSFDLSITLPVGSSELERWYDGQSPQLTTITAFTEPSYAIPRSRQQYIAKSIQWFRYNPSHLLFGSLGPHFGYGKQGEILTKILGLDSSITNLFGAINERVGLPFNAYSYSVQLPRLMFELGAVGLFCFLLLFWRVRQMGKAVFQLSELDPWMCGQAVAFRAIWLLYVVLSVFYLDVWRADHTSFPFWLWAAALYNAQTRSNRNYHVRTKLIKTSLAAVR